MSSMSTSARSGSVSREEMVWWKVMRSARPLSRAHWRARAMDGSGSTAWTCRAPACAAQKAITPVGVPSSSTSAPGRTAARMDW